VQFVKDNDVVLEVCPYSNWLTGACKTLKEHPLPRLIKEGIKVTISTDDPGLFGTNIITEYTHILGNELMTLEQLVQANNLAYQHSFIPEHIKSKYWKCNT